MLLTNWFFEGDDDDDDKVSTELGREEAALCAADEAWACPKTWVDSLEC